MMECFCSTPYTIHCKIVLLDDQDLIHEIQDNCVGQALLDVVFQHLNLLETAYFGLRFLDGEGQTHWLDPAKKLNRQLKGADPYTLYFGVKFYAVDPCKLLEEITRYQFFLQVKQDILQGRLPVSFELAAELGAYIVQSELGDYDSRRHSAGYVSEFRFLANQTVELEARICDQHKTLVGQLPSVAELNYLDKIKWLEMYGVDLHPVLGEDNVEYFLGLTPSGIIVLRNKSIVGNYYWPRISKIYFKGRYFMLRVTDKNNDESTYGFETPSRAACKHLWKCCVEHHAFFRLVQVSPTTPDIFALGSRFRYSGRTEKQAVRDAQMKVRTPPSFSRTSSRRYQRRVVEGATDSSGLEDTVKIDHYETSEVKHVSIPQPAPSFDSPYRATCNVTSPSSVVTINRNIQPQQQQSSQPSQRSDSPRSTRSAPWSQPHSRGLYNSSVPASPRSVRSAGPRYRSSSVDSQSSNDSRSCKRRKHRSRMISDNESELSKCSGRSHRKHRRHRSRGNRRDSGSEQDSQSYRRKSLNRVRHSDSHYELVDSGSQWREVQRKQAIDSSVGNSAIQQATVISSRKANAATLHVSDAAAPIPSADGGNDNDGQGTYRSTGGSNGGRRQRQKKHRSSSQSPDGKWLPDELKKHLEFDLIDTAGMTDSQLREIPYTVVQTNHAKQMKIKHLQWMKNEVDKRTTDSPPPPYSPAISESGRIRAMRVSNTSSKGHQFGLLPVTHASKAATASIASNSSTHSSSNSNLPRMLDSLSISDNYVFNGSQRGVGRSGTSGSVYTASHQQLPQFPTNSLLSNGFNDHIVADSLRLSHEHTDSGLGGEQDCAYSSERSSDSAKHGGGGGGGICGSVRDLAGVAKLQQQHHLQQHQPLLPNLPNTGGGSTSLLASSNCALPVSTVVHQHLDQSTVTSSSSHKARHHNTPPSPSSQFMYRSQSSSSRYGPAAAKVSLAYNVEHQKTIAIDSSRNTNIYHHQQQQQHQQQLPLLHPVNSGRFTANTTATTTATTKSSHASNNNYHQYQESSTQREQRTARSVVGLNGNGESSGSSRYWAPSSSTGSSIRSKASGRSEVLAKNYDDNVYYVETNRNLSHFPQSTSTLGVPIMGTTSSIATGDPIQGPIKHGLSALTTTKPRDFSEMSTEL